MSVLRLEKPHELDLVQAGVVGDVPKVLGHPGNQGGGDDMVRGAVGGTLFIGSAEVAVPMCLLRVAPLLVQYAAAVGADQQPEEWYGSVR